MTVYEIPNIEHCTVTPVGTIGYRITAHDGWYIHLNDGVEDTVNVWKGAVILRTDYNFEQVEIRAEADLPEGAEIYGAGDDNEPEHEVM
jgi:hypothetical protein